MRSFHSSYHKLVKVFQQVESVDLPAVEENVGTLHASLGSIPANFAPSASTAWVSLAAMHDEVERVGRSAQQLESDVQDSN